MQTGMSGPRLLVLLAGLLLAITLGATGVVASNLELAVGNGTAPPDDTVQVPVNLTSEGQVIMLQFDVSYDRGLLSLQEVELGNSLKATHIVVTNQVGGRQRVMAYNANLKPIPKGLQTVVTLTLTVAPNAQAGQKCELELSNVMIADAGNNDLSGQAELTGGRFVTAGMVSGSDEDSLVEPEEPAAQLGNSGLPVTLPTADGENLPVANNTSGTIGNVNSRVVNPVQLADIAGHWAEAQIIRLVDKGAINGYPDSTFKPENLITRAEFTKVLVELLGLSVRNGKVFADTAGHWARDYIDRAATSGLISGYEANRFGPDDPLTREQMAAIMVKAARMAAASTGLSFSDSDQVSGWAREAVATARAHGLISGYPDGSFRPQSSATRAEAVSVTRNIFNISPPGFDQED